MVSFLSFLMISSGESMTPVFFSVWQCLQKSEFDIYEVLINAPKQRHLKINYFATEKESHNSKVPGSKALLSKRFFQVQFSLIWGMYLFHLLQPKKFTVNISTRGPLFTLLEPQIKSLPAAAPQLPPLEMLPHLGLAFPVSFRVFDSDSFGVLFSQKLFPPSFQI